MYRSPAKGKICNTILEREIQRKKYEKLRDCRRRVWGNDVHRDEKIHLEVKQKVNVREERENGDETKEKGSGDEARGKGSDGVEMEKASDGALGLASSSDRTAPTIQ